MAPPLLRQLDRWLIPLLFVVGLIAGLRHIRSTETGNVLWSDAEGYYLYLPATFIYGDWQQFDGEDGVHMIACCAVSKDKKLVQTRYTYGVSILEVPFFLAAHAYASLAQGAGTPPPADYDRPRDNDWAQRISDRRWTELRGRATGWSYAYSAGIVVSGIFYLCLGLFFVKETLKRWFKPETALATVAVIFLGTNLFYYSTQEPGMSHVYSFCLFAGFLYLTPRFLKGFQWKTTLLMGLITGLILLIRPTNLIILLVLLGYEVYSPGELRRRIGELLLRWKDVLIILGVTVLLIVPQLLYWKYAFGSWLTYSYGDEGFIYWNRPRILQVLFSHQNGWFMYSPVMLLAMVGIGAGLRKRKLSAPVQLLILALATYTFASWWAWWFGGAFGHRCYVEFYALLAWPLAWTISQLLHSRRRALRMAMVGALLGFIYLNLKMTAMYDPPWDGEGWTMSSYLGVLKGALKFWYWP
jgi:hypothetical protein